MHFAFEDLVELPAQSLAGVSREAAGRARHMFKVLSFAFRAELCRNRWLTRWPLARSLALWEKTWARDFTFLPALFLRAQSSASWQRSLLCLLNGRGRERRARNHP